MHRFGTRLARHPQPRKIASIATPESLDVALDLLTEPDSTPIVGGTDHLPARRQGLANESHLVDVLLIPELGQLETNSTLIRLGGSVRLARVAGLCARPEERLLAEAASSIATPQIRAMATVAGNLCQQKRCWFYRNGFDCYKRGGVTCPCYAVMGDHRFYHAAIDGHRCQAVTPSDLATALSCLDASITIAGAGRRRSVPIDEFFVGPGETTLKSDELVVHVDVPTGTYTSVAYEKLNQWEGDFAIVSAAVAMRLVDGVIERAALTVGAIAPTPFRLRHVESALEGRRVAEVHLVDLLERTWSRHGHPLARNEWKLDAATSLVERAFSRAAELAPRRSA